MTGTGEPSEDGPSLPGMRTYLEGTGIVFAVLFGSHARGAASESSDVDVALKFPETMGDYERFTARNRIDAELQEYAEGFVDVSDIDSLPLPVAHAALRDGVVLAGDERAIDEYRERIDREYEDSAEERERERRAFIDRLARGDP